MTSPKRSLTVERARRTGIKALIREARISAMVCCKASIPTVAQQLEALANVAEDYLNEVNHGK